HLDGAHATSLALVAAELLHLAEELVDVAGILLQQAALEHEGIVLAGAVADFAEAVYALVGVDADDRAVHGRAADGEDTEVGDLQSRRLGVGVGVLRQGFGRFAGPEAG